LTHSAGPHPGPARQPNGSPTAAYHPTGTLAPPSPPFDSNRSPSPNTRAWMARLEGCWDHGQVLSHPKGVSRVIFAPKGDRFVVVGVWDPALLVYARSGGPNRYHALHRLDDAADFVLAAAFSPDGRVFAAGAQDRVFRLYDAAADPPIRRCEIPDPKAHAVAVAFCGVRPAGENDRRKRRRKARRAARRKAAGIASDSSDSSGVSASDSATDSDSAADAVSDPVLTHVLAAAYSDHRLTFYAYTPGGSTVTTLLSENHRDRSGVATLSFAPATGLLAAGCRDGTLLLYDCKRSVPEIIDERSDQADAVLCVAFAPTGGLLAVVVAQDQRVLVYGLQNGTLAPLYSLFDALDSVTCVRFSPDGTLLAVGSKDRKMRLYALSAAAMHCVSVVPLTDWVLDIDMDATSGCLAAGCADGMVTVYRLNP